MEFDLSVYAPDAEPRMVRFKFDAAPMVSCLMVSRGDANLCAQAIGAFRAQTYGNSELVVVSQDANPPVRQLVEAHGDPRIRFVQAQAGTLGALRNASVTAARGDLVCIWDDDDLYDKRRIELMASALMATKSDAAFLSRLTVWWPARRRLALSQSRLWEGSMLAVKAKLPPYPDLQRREDTEMVEAFRKYARVTSLDAPGAYVYRVTGRNTWDDAFFEMVFDRATQDLTPEYAARTAGWPLPG